MKVPIRYQMNMGVLTEEELMHLQTKEVIIVGLGGLGGNLANQLVRLGVNHLTLIDFDRFSESNLNRQLFSNMNNIGHFKVDVVSDELKKIHPNIVLNTIKGRIEDIQELQGDYIIDCVDHIETKIYLSKLSKQLNKPLLHGSCGGWYGQVGWILPNSSLIEDLYSKEDTGLEEDLLNPPYAPNVVASFMASEFTKMIKNSPTLVVNQILFIDLYENALIKLGDHKHG